MSNEHCKFIFSGNKFYIEDFASTNGIWL